MIELRFSQLAMKRWNGMLHKKVILLLLPFILLLSACTGPIDEEQEKAKDNALEAFEKDPIQPNEEIANMKLYVPRGLEVAESDANNIVFSEDEKLYILFVNPNEERTSQVLYESTLATIEKPRLNEKFQEDDQFGYIIIHDISEEIFGLTVGIGGVKLSTETTTDKIAADAEKMMEIVASLQVVDAENKE